MPPSIDNRVIEEGVRLGRIGGRLLTGEVA